MADVPVAVGEAVGTRIVPSVAAAVSVMVIPTVTKTQSVAACAAPVHPTKQAIARAERKASERVSGDSAPW
jgi:hypothetical protein